MSEDKFSIYINQQHDTITDEELDDIIDNMSAQDYRDLNDVKYEMDGEWEEHPDFVDNFISNPESPKKDIVDIENFLSNHDNSNNND